ncbi:hypothetical protein GC175_11350 [bacterium]|nr:hypothetical protein [bacterium]
MPRFIVDECTGMSVVIFLCAQGYDTISVSETMPQAVDVDILQRAVTDNRIVVTNDRDFGDMVFRDRRAHRGIILLRLSDDLPATKLHVLDAVLKEHLERLTDHFVVVTEDNIRIRSRI